jgi:hypothetical protein
MNTPSMKETTAETLAETTAVSSRSEQARAPPGVLLIAWRELRFAEADPQTARHHTDECGEDRGWRRKLSS